MQLDRRGNKTQLIFEYYTQSLRRVYRKENQARFVLHESKTFPCHHSQNGHRHRLRPTTFVRGAHQSFQIWYDVNNPETDESWTNLGAYTRCKEYSFRASPPTQVTGKIYHSFPGKSQQLDSNSRIKFIGHIAAATCQIQ